MNSKKKKNKISFLLKKKFPERSSCTSLFMGQVCFFVCSSKLKKGKFEKTNKKIQQKKKSQEFLKNILFSTVIQTHTVFYV